MKHIKRRALAWVLTGAMLCGVFPTAPSTTYYAYATEDVDSITATTPANGTDTSGDTTGDVTPANGTGTSGDTTGDVTPANGTDTSGDTTGDTVPDDGTGAPDDTTGDSDAALYATWAAAAAAATNADSTGDYYQDAATGNVTIYTAVGLAWFANQVNTGTNTVSGKTVTLASDINLTDAGVSGYHETTIMADDYTGTDTDGDTTTTPVNNSWTAIGTSSNAFQGTFDGGTHTVSGVYININITNTEDKTDDYQGLFGYVYGTDDALAVVKNVTVSGAITSTGYYIGGVVGYGNYSTITNATVSGAITSTNDYIGGVVGYSNYSTITNATVSGEITSARYNVGGVVGYSDNSTITTATNNATITGNGFVGGVVGFSDNGTVETSHNTGAVHGEGGNVGGVAGYNNSGTVKTSYNTGDIHSETQSVGGVVGQSKTATNGDTATVEHCYNTGDVRGETQFVGGVVGCNSDGSVQHCYSTGNIEGSESLGGVVGYNMSATVQHCYSTGNVNGSGSKIGGVVGYNTLGATVANCVALGGSVSCSTSGTTSVHRVIGSTEGSFTNNYASADMTVTIADTAQESTTATISGADGATLYFNAQGTVFDATSDETNPIWRTETDGVVTNFSWSALGFTTDSDNGWTLPTGDGSNTKLPSLDGKTYPDNPMTTSNIPTEYTTWKQVATWAFVGEDYTISEDGNTYTINTAKGLAWFANQVNTGTNTFSGKTVTLAKDIDLTTAGVVGYVGADSNTTGNTAAETVTQTNSWTAIGTSSNAFQGTFDGGTHTVSGVYININITNTEDKTDDYQGLFGYVYGTDDALAVVKNVTVSGAITSTGDSVGGVVGYGNYSTITDATNHATITGNQYVGGVVGQNDGTVQTSYNTGDVNGEGNYVGGVVGNNCGTVTTSYNTGDVNGEGNYVGGVVGNNEGTVQTSYNTGNININGDGVGCIGGVAGGNMGTVTTSYNTGNINGGGGSVGGVVGQNDGTVQNCIALGTRVSTSSVSATNIGRVVGQNNNGTLTNNYASADMTVTIADTAQESTTATISGADGATLYFNAQGTVFDATSDETNPIWRTETDGVVTNFSWSALGFTTHSDNGWTLPTGDGSNTKLPSLDGKTYPDNPMTTSNIPTEYTTWKQAATWAFVGEDYTISEDGNTYTINTAKGLAWFANQVNTGTNTFSGKTVTLAKDIDLTTAGVVGYVGADSNTTGNTAAETVTQTNSWTAIGKDANNAFQGTFDGGTHTVSGVYINITNTEDKTDDYQGLFGYVLGTDDALAVVKNVTVSGAITSTGDSVGGVVGYAINATITDATNHATITGNQYVGGVVGRNATANSGTATVKNCYNTGAVHGTGAYVGGVVGHNFNNVSGTVATVAHCYNTGAVSSIGDGVGGVVGRNYTGGSGGTTTVKHCYNTGVVSSKGDYVGGVVGWNYNATSGAGAVVSNCLSLGESVSTSKAGVSNVRRVAGYNANATLQNNYAREDMTVNDATVTSTKANDVSGTSLYFWRIVK